MSDREPAPTRNLGRVRTALVALGQGHDVLPKGPGGPLAGFFLVTVDSHDRPPVAGIGVVCHDGDRG
jgi:hypothetical protein